MDVSVMQSGHVLYRVTSSVLAVEAFRTGLPTDLAKVLLRQSRCHQDYPADCSLALAYAVMCITQTMGGKSMPIFLANASVAAMLTLILSTNFARAA